MLTADQLPQYWALMRETYGPHLSRLGFDPRRGQYADAPPTTRSLREALLPLVALEGRDPEVRATLLDAAEAYLDGNAQALDPAFAEVAFSVAVQDRGEPFMRELKDALVASNDPVLRRQATLALGSADTPALAAIALDLAFSPGLHALETTLAARSLANQPAGRDALESAFGERFEELAAGMPVYVRPRVVQFLGGFCSEIDVAKVEALMRPKLETLGGGELELELTKERIGMCASLRAAKSEEIAAVLSAMDR
jgi:hypothetical protein